MLDYRPVRTARLTSLTVTSIAVLALTACGGSDAATEGETRSVEDAWETVEVPVEPSRVIADSVSTYAHLMSLGITPIAVALPVGISPEYIGPDAGDVDSVVAEDGWTIDVEEALALDPDLIVAVGADYNKENCDRYRQVAATFCFVETFETGTDEDIRATVRDLAAALGREDEAEAAIAAYDERVAELADRVAATDLVDQQVGIVRIDAGGFIGIRTGDLANSSLAALGIGEPDWPAPTVDGYVELSLETLGLLDEADILLVTTDDDVIIEDSSVFTSPLWEQLDVVQEGRAHFVGAWNGFDMPQLMRILDDLETTLVEPAEGS